MLITLELRACRNANFISVDVMNAETTTLYAMGVFDWSVHQSALDTGIMP